MTVLFFKPIARPAIWGNTLIKDYFGYDEFPSGIGQSWAFSAQRELSSICLNVPYKNQTLLDIWNNHQELFGNPGGDFPFIISLVAPEDDLSVQVHPNDCFAKKIGYLHGKNEAWYFLEAQRGSKIIYGHNAKDETDLLRYINEERWDQLIRYLDVCKDDFVYIPAGLLHALKKGNIVYEVQQSTDVTYRFYDYHRKDESGKERQLHLQEAIKCLSYDTKKMSSKIIPEVHNFKNYRETKYISNDSFTIKKLEIKGKCAPYYENYQLATIVKGQGKIDGEIAKIGDSFLIPVNTTVTYDGNMIIMLTAK